MNSEWPEIQNMIQDPDISEILINGPNEIWIEEKGTLRLSPFQFESPIIYRQFLEWVARLIGRFPSLESPFAQGAFENCRVQLLSPPVSEHYALAIRKRTQNPWTLARLAENNWANHPHIQILQQLIHERKNLLFVGGTSSGKTSALSACLLEVQPSERIVILEDTDEIPRPNQASLKLLGRSDPQSILPEIPLSELVRTALRLRPDRLVVGEVRGAEAKDLLLAISTGHTGSFATLHARDAHEALIRLEMLVQMGAPQWDLQSIRRLIQFSIDAIVVVKKSVEGPRRLNGIYRLASREDFGFSLEKMTYFQKIN